MFFRCGTKMSFRAVRKPHMKNSVVAIAIALLSVETGVAVTIGDCGVAIAMQFRASILFRSTFKQIFSESAAKVASKKKLEQAGLPRGSIKAGGHNLSHKRRPTLVVVMGFFNNDAENSPANGIIGGDRKPCR